jgi:hypothetical protein
LDEAAAQDTAASLTYAKTERVVNIATDSLGSIRQVFKANTRPQDLQEHRHLSLITSIADKVASHARTIHLWKVKSHIGIVGNEHADCAAGQVAKGELPQTQILQFTQPSNDRDNMAWPHTEHMTESNEIRMTPLANMRETLMGITMHTGKLGTANQESIYFPSPFNLLRSRSLVFGFFDYYLLYKKRRRNIYIYKMYSSLNLFSFYIP